jgi:16S rRNA (uracil1498-N3)-methyltransferase
MRVLVDAASIAAGRAVVRGDDHHYLFRVRRLAPGARLVVFDGEGTEADAEVEQVAAEEAVLRVENPRREAAPALRITVIQGLIKGERMDWCVQKLVEVGVDRIVLVATERAVVKLDPARAASRKDRLAAIAREAAKQARRATVPGIEVATLAEALATPADLRLVCHPSAELALRDVLPRPASSAALLVGPEGGLAPGEVERALSAGFEAVRLGGTVLRAETAGVAAVAALRLGRSE